MFPSIRQLGIAILMVSGFEIAATVLDPLPSRAEIVTLPNGVRCDGQFQGLNGRGLCIYAEEPISSPYNYYEGEIRNGQPNGSGLFVFANGDRYEGQVSNGQPNGRGTFVFANGDRYVGQIRNGVAQGTGTFRFANGDRYSGGMREGQPHGRGTFIFAGGQSYNGQFYLGQVNGRGVLIHPNGMRCEGDFYNSQFTGKGTCTIPSGRPFRRYSGELSNGLPNGVGNYVR